MLLPPLFHWDELLRFGHSNSLSELFLSYYIVYINRKCYIPNKTILLYLTINVAGYVCTQRQVYNYHNDGDYDY